MQIYVAPRSPAVSRPVQELKGFAKVHLAPGETRTAEIVLSPRAFAHWNPGDRYRSALRPSPTGERAVVATDSDGWWQVDAGHYDVRVASSSAQIDAVVTVTMVESGRWSAKDVN